MQRSCADVNSPYKRKCWTNSGGPLVNSLLWGKDMYKKRWRETNQEHDNPAGKCDDPQTDRGREQVRLYNGACKTMLHTLYIINICSVIFPHNFRGEKSSLVVRTFRKPIRIMQQNLTIHLCKSRSSEKLCNCRLWFWFLSSACFLRFN